MSYVIPIGGWVNFSGGGGGSLKVPGGYWEKDSLPILGLQRLASLLWVSDVTQDVYIFSKIQLVVYYQCCILIGWATTRLYVITH